VSIKSKTYQFKNRTFTVNEAKDTGEIIKYDTDNKFPQNLISQISESGTATSCVEALNQYGYANGFVDETLGKTKVNDTQTFNELLVDAVQQAVMFNAVAFHVSRDAFGNIIKLKSIPFENIRKTENCFIYNSTFSNRYDAKKDIKFCAYKGKTVDAEQLAEIASYVNDKGEPVGEIFYYFKKKPGQYIYPLPSYYSAISDINTDAENSKYELESVNNSFLPSGILTLVGKIDNENKDENGRTEWDDINATLSEFTGNSKDSKGESGRQKLAVFHAKTKEELPNYIPVNNEGILTAIDTSTKRVAEKVSRAFGVPPFIIGLGGSVGFSTDIISDNISLFNNRVLLLQNLVKDVFQSMFDFDFTITQLNPIRFIPKEILSDLTTSERRDLYGYKTDESKANTNVSLAQTLGVGGTQSLVAIIQDTILTPPQKINTLVILFNLSAENATRLVYGNV
jgi:hypothetical protein